MSSSSSEWWSVAYDHLHQEVDLTINVSGEGRFLRGVIANLNNDVLQLDSYRPSYMIIGKEKMKRTRHSKTYVQLKDIVALASHTHDDVEKVL